MGTYTLKNEGMHEPNKMPEIPEDGLMNEALYIFSLNNSRRAMIDFIMKLGGFNEAIKAGDQKLHRKLLEMGYKVRPSENGWIHLDDLIPVVGDKLNLAKSEPPEAPDEANNSNT